MTSLVSGVTSRNVKAGEDLWPGTYSQPTENNGDNGKCDCAVFWSLHESLFDDEVRYLSCPPDQM